MEVSFLSAGALQLFGCAMGKTCLHEFVALPKGPCLIGIFSWTSTAGRKGPRKKKNLKP